MSGMGWKLKCGIGTLSQGMHVFCGPVVFQHLFLRLNQVQRRLKVRLLEDLFLMESCLSLRGTLRLFNVLLHFLFSCEEKWP